MIFGFVCFVIGHTASEKLSKEQVASISIDSLQNIYRLQLIKDNELKKLPDSIKTTTDGFRNPFFISKSDSNNQLLWIMNVGGSPFELPNKLFNDPENNLYLLGTVGNQFAFNQSGGNGVDQTMSNTAFMVKYNSDGKQEWACFIFGLDLYRYYNLSFLNGQAVIEGYYEGFLMRRAIYPYNSIYWRY